MPMIDYEKRFAELRAKYGTQVFYDNLKIAFPDMCERTLDLKWKIKHNYVGNDKIDESKRFTNIYFDQEEIGKSELTISRQNFAVYSSNVYIYTRHDWINNIALSFGVNLEELDSKIKHFDKVGADVMDYCTSIVTMHLRTILYAIFGCKQEYLPIVDAGTLYLAQAMKTGKFEKEDLLDWDIKVRQPDNYFPACTVDADLYLGELVKL